MNMQEIQKRLREQLEVSDNDVPYAEEAKKFVDLFCTIRLAKEWADRSLKFLYDIGAKGLKGKGFLRFPNMAALRSIIPGFPLTKELEEHLAFRDIALTYIRLVRRAWNFCKYYEHIQGNLPLKVRLENLKHVQTGLAKTLSKDFSGENTKALNESVRILEKLLERYAYDAIVRLVEVRVEPKRHYYKA